MLHSADGMTTVAWVPRGQLAAAAAVFAPQLRRGAEVARTSEAEIIAEAGENGTLLGVAYGEKPFSPLGVWVATVRDNYVDVYALAGREAHRWLSLGLELVTELAGINDIKAIHAVGRRAWLRKLPVFREIGSRGKGQSLLRIEV